MDQWCQKLSRDYDTRPCLLAHCKCKDIWESLDLDVFRLAVKTDLVLELFRVLHLIYMQQNPNTKVKGHLFPFSFRKLLQTEKAQKDLAQMFGAETVQKFCNSSLSFKWTKDF